MLSRGFLTGCETKVLDTCENYHSLWRIWQLWGTWWIWVGISVLGSIMTILWFANISNSYWLIPGHIGIVRASKATPTAPTFHSPLLHLRRTGTTFLPCHLRFVEVATLDFPQNNCSYSWCTLDNCTLYILPYNIMHLIKINEVSLSLLRFS